MPFIFEVDRGESRRVEYQTGIWVGFDWESG